MRASHLASFALAMALLGACGDDDSESGDVTAEDGGREDAGARDSGTQNLDAALARSTGAWVAYPNPYGDGGVNPAADIQGAATASAADGGMRVSLNVSGLPPNRTFGSHIHRLACDDMMAGGHYQHNPAPSPDASADPMYANATNEAWLDFTTNATGAAMVTANVAWTPRDGQANAIIVHDRMTATGGVAGPKLACLNIPF